MKDSIQIALAAPVALTSALMENVSFETKPDAFSEPLTLLVRGASINQTEDAIQAASAKLFTNGEHFHRRIQFPRERWSIADERRFDDLSVKEALGELIAAEAAELETLDADRRLLLNPVSTDEILNRYAREKFDRGMLKLLTHHVRIAPLPKNPA